MIWTEKAWLIANFVLQCTDYPISLTNFYTLVKQSISTSRVQASLGTLSFVCIWILFQYGSTDPNTYLWNPTGNCMYSIAMMCWKTINLQKRLLNDLSSVLELLQCVSVLHNCLNIVNAGLVRTLKFYSNWGQRRDFTLPQQDEHNYIAWNLYKDILWTDHSLMCFIQNLRGCPANYAYCIFPLFPQNL